MGPCALLGLFVLWVHLAGGLDRPSHLGSRGLYTVDKACSMIGQTLQITGYQSVPSHCGAGVASVSHKGANFIRLQRAT